jgi:hypothetical protein
MRTKKTVKGLNPILVDIGEKKELGKLLNASHPTVRKALAGEIESPQALRIRKAAIERGGIEKSVEPDKK